jgi:hypothetical protein
MMVIYVIQTHSDCGLLGYRTAYFRTVNASASEKHSAFIFKKDNRGSRFCHEAEVAGFPEALVRTSYAIRNQKEKLYILTAVKTSNLIQFINVFQFAGFDILTEFCFCDIAPRSLVKVSRRFQETYRVDLRDRIVSPARNSVKQSALFSSCRLLSQKLQLIVIKIVT